MRAIFYTHQTSGACAGICTCDRAYQMRKTVLVNLSTIFVFYFTTNKHYLMTSSFLKSLIIIISVSHYKKVIYLYLLQIFGLSRIPWWKNKFYKNLSSHKISRCWELRKQKHITTTKPHREHLSPWQSKHF